MNSAWRCAQWFQRHVHASTLSSSSQAFARDFGARNALLGYTRLPSTGRASSFLFQTQQQSYATDKKPPTTKTTVKQTTTVRKSTAASMAAQIQQARVAKAAAPRPKKSATVSPVKKESLLVDTETVRKIGKGNADPEQSLQEYEAYLNEVRKALAEEGLSPMKSNEFS